MINFKKLLAGTLSAAMVLGTMAMPVFADESSVELNVGKGQNYSTFEEARVAVAEDVTNITYVIHGKVVMPEGEVTDVVGKAKNAQTVTFKAAENDTTAEIALEATSINMMGRLNPVVDVNYENLILSRTNGKYISDYGEMNHYFTTSASEKIVTYTKCSFPNGACNNQYGKTVYNDCSFTASNGGYGLWIYAYNVKGNPTGQVEVVGGKVEGNRGVKTYSMDQNNETDVTIRDTKFKVLADEKSKPAIMLSQTGKIVLSDIDTTECTTAIVAAEVADGGTRTNKSLAEVTIDGEKKPFAVTANSKFYTTVADAKTDGVTEENINSVVAKIDNVYFATLADAVDAANDGDTIKILSDVKESVEIVSDKNITLDLNGKTLTNTDGKHTIENRGILTVTDSSTDKSGKVDNVSNGKIPFVNYEGGNATLSGGSFDRSLENGKVGATADGCNSGYTIKNWGIMTINEGVSVNNKSDKSSGSSAIGNGYQKGATFDGHTGITTANVKLTINGGKFTGGLNTIKNDDYAELEINGGEFENYTQQCIMNWNKAVINNGKFTGKENGNVIYNGYDNDNMDKGILEIKGGEFNGKIQVYDPNKKGQTSISGGTFSTDVSAYCADGYQLAKNADGKYVAVPQTLTNGIEVKFEQVEGNAGLYNIMLKATDTNAINRLTSADLTFKLETEDAITYEIKKVGDMNVTPKADNYNRYLFSFDGKNTASETVTEIVIGQVEFTGYGTFTFGVDSGATTNIVNATKTVDNIVTSYVVGGSAEAEGELDIDSKLDNIELKPETADLIVNVSFPNAIKDNAVAYQNMKVTVSGNGVNKEFKLGTGNDGVALNNDKYTVNIENELVKNNTYTVTVSGAGYRTARYTVSMTGNKELNFWNNVKTAPMVIEKDSTGTGVNTNFLAGDIVKDGQINIYDLSAVVSYFGTNGLSVSNHPEYAKYDLNRDGVIDSKDVAYALVSWGK